MAEYEKAFKRGWFGIILLVMIFVAYMFGTATHWQDLFRDGWEGWLTFKEYFTGTRSASADMRQYFGGKFTDASQKVQTIAEGVPAQWEEGWEKVPAVPTTQLSEEEKLAIKRNADVEIDIDNPSPDAIRFLLSQLSDPGDETRKAAAAALRDMGRIDTVPSMLVTVKSNKVPDRYICDAAAEIVTRYPPDVQRRVLAQALYGLGVELPSACTYQLGGIFKSQGGESREFLQECLEKGRDSVRSFGLRSLTEQFPQEARAVVANYLKDESPRVRIEAVHSMAYLEMREARDTLLPLEQDPDPAVADAARRTREKMLTM